jgi:hypothetical protein
MFCGMKAFCSHLRNQLVRSNFQTGFVCVALGDLGMRKQHTKP